MHLRWFGVTFAVQYRSISSLFFFVCFWHFVEQYVHILPWYLLILALILKKPSDFYFTLICILRQSEHCRWWLLETGRKSGLWILIIRWLHSFPKSFSFFVSWTIRIFKGNFETIWNNCEKKFQEYWSTSWDYFTEITSTIWNILERIWKLMRNFIKSL